jgi:hypothetical protein
VYVWPEMAPLQGDEFGAAIAVYGRWAVIGASRASARTAASAIGSSISEAGLAFMVDIYSARATDVLSAHRPTLNAHFGCAVAISSTNVVIGAERAALCDKRGCRTRDGGADAAVDAPRLAEFGAVHIYARRGHPRYNDQDEHELQFLQQLYAHDPFMDARFGGSLAINRNGLLAVGARGTGEAGRAAGEVYLYRFDHLSGSVLFITKLTPTIGALSGAASSRCFSFGTALAMTTHVMVVGAPRARFPCARFAQSGVALVFDLASFVQTAWLVPTDAAQNDEFGFAVAVAKDTTRVGGRQRHIALVGAPGVEVQSYGQPTAVGAVYRIDLEAGICARCAATVRWASQQRAEPSRQDSGEGGRYGSALAIDEASGLALSGAPRRFGYAGARQGEVFFARLPPSTSGVVGGRQQSLPLVVSNLTLHSDDAVGEDLFGGSVALNAQGVAVIGAKSTLNGATSHAGGVYIFYPRLASPPRPPPSPPTQPPTTAYTSQNYVVTQQVSIALVDASSISEEQLKQSLASGLDGVAAADIEVVTLEIPEREAVSVEMELDLTCATFDRPSVTSTLATQYGVSAALISLDDPCPLSAARARALRLRALSALARTRMGARFLAAMAITITIATVAADTNAVTVTNTPLSIEELLAAVKGVDDAALGQALGAAIGVPVGLTSTPPKQKTLPAELLITFKITTTNATTASLAMGSLGSTTELTSILNVTVLAVLSAPKLLTIELQVPNPPPSAPTPTPARPSYWTSATLAATAAGGAIAAFPLCLLVFIAVRVYMERRIKYGPEEALPRTLSVVPTPPRPTMQHGSRSLGGASTVASRGVPSSLPQHVPTLVASPARPRSLHFVLPLPPGTSQADPSPTPMPTLTTAGSRIRTQPMTGVRLRTGITMSEESEGMRAARAAEVWRSATSIIMRRRRGSIADWMRQAEQRKRRLGSGEVGRRSPRDACCSNTSTPTSISLSSAAGSTRGGGRAWHSRMPPPTPGMPSRYRWPQLLPRMVDAFTSSHGEEGSPLPPELDMWVTTPAVPRPPPAMPVLLVDSFTTMGQDYSTYGQIQRSRDGMWVSPRGHSLPRRLPSRASGGGLGGDNSATSPPHHSAMPIGAEGSTSAASPPSHQFECAVPSSRGASNATSSPSTTCILGAAAPPQLAHEDKDEMELQDLDDDERQVEAGEQQGEEGPAAPIQPTAPNGLPRDGPVEPRRLGADHERGFGEEEAAHSARGGIPQRFLLHSLGIGSDCDGGRSLGADGAAVSEHMPRSRASLQGRTRRGSLGARVAAISAAPSHSIIATPSLHSSTTDAAPSEAANDSKLSHEPSLALASRPETPPWARQLRATATARWASFEQQRARRTALAPMLAARFVTAAAVLPPSPTPHRELVPNPATHAALIDMEDEGMAIEQIEMNAPSTPLEEEEL